MNENNNKSYNDLIDHSIYFLKKNDLSSARNLLEKAIKLNPKKILAYINLSNIYILENKINRSTKLLKNYLNQYEYNIEIINHLGKIFYKFGYLNEMLNLEKFIIKKNIVNKNLYYVYFLFGLGFEKKEKISEAIKVYKKSIRYKKNFIESYLNLCNVFEKTNKINDLKKIINLANNNCLPDPRLNYFMALYKYIEKNYSESQSIIINKKLMKKLEEHKLYYIDLLNLKFKNFEKLQNFKMAFEAVTQRNNCIYNKEENKNYNKKKILNTIEKYKKFYKAEKLKKTYNKNINHPNIAFIIGFPRSGTTLLDTILRSHPKTLVLEEKPHILNLRHDYFKKNNNILESINEITNDEIDLIQKKYLELINYKNKNDKKIIIDKFPLTIIEIAFVKKIFPESKIILSMRHPCDSVLSCYFSYFKMNDAMINFLNLKDTVLFYNKIFEFFNLYNKNFNLNHFIVKYEDLVLKFENTVKDILDFLNLNYEEKLNRFYETAKKRNKINTPSYNQVIQPLYSSSIGRWKKYKNVSYLEEELKKWIIKYRY